jgi:hypothetical protein
MSGGIENAAKRERELKKMEWEALKQQGSAHYKTGSVEPIDLYKAGGMFNNFARCSIIKYAFRMKGVEDLHKIIHYVNLLLADMTDGKQ